MCLSRPSRTAGLHYDPPRSRSKIYGDPDVHPQPETYWGKVNPIGVRSCYDEGKRCAETLFFDYHRQHGVKIKVARIFNTYGPGMHPQDGRVVSNFIMQTLKGEELTIYGDGKQTRSFCYVDDLIIAFQLLMDSDDEFAYSEANDEEHIEWYGEATYDDYFDWE